MTSENPKYVDVLEEDKPLAGQKFVCVSFLSPETKKMVYPKLELVRFAFPRRTYTLSHILYVVDIIISVCKRSKSIKGIEITESPELLKHFSSKFNWIN